MAGVRVDLEDVPWDEMRQWADQTVEARWQLIFSSDRTGTDTLSLGLAEIPPGEELPLHHHGPSEIYHAVEGRGVVEIEGETHELAPGTSVFIPSNARHVTRNTGEAPLRFLFVFAVDALDDVDYHFEDRA